MNKPRKCTEILNIIAGKLSTMLLIVRFCNYREIYIKTKHLNKETKFHNLIDPRAWLILKGL